MTPKTPRTISSMTLSCTALAAAALVLLGSCTHSRKTQSQPAREYALKQLIPYTLKVRRPLSPGANPKAGPGGIDYQSDPLPGPGFDCQDVNWLFREFKLKELRECLAFVVIPSPPAPTITELKFNVRWQAVPELVLETDEETPECLRALIPRIPVPREVFFQSYDEQGKISCYSSRFDVEANEVGGFRLPFGRTALRVQLPLDPEPKDDAEMRMQLMAWALTPFWDRVKDTLPSRLVMDTVCRQCLGEKTMLGPDTPAPFMWPETPKAAKE
jgi:hypothetical protein